MHIFKNTAPSTLATWLLFLVLAALCVSVYRTLVSRLHEVVVVDPRTAGEQKLKVAELGRAAAALATRMASLKASGDTHVQDNSTNAKPSLRQKVESAAPAWVISRDAHDRLQVNTGESTPAMSDDTRQAEPPTYSNQSRVLIATATAQQEETFHALKRRFDDQGFVRSLNLDQLTATTEFKSLPGELQLVLLSMAVARFNSGEVSPEQFSLPPPGSRVVQSR